MIIFNDKEFEIAIVTYNRASFVKEWLDKCFFSCVKRNIMISIYDSSTNDDTEKLIKKYNNENNTNINYTRVDSDTSIGYKSMYAILNSSFQYVWVAGDSLRYSFEDLDERVFPYMKEGIEYILLQAMTNLENDGRIYTDRSIFLRDCFVSLTAIGLSIYKREIFDCFRDNEQLLKDCDNKYRDNYAFAWLGYFLEAFSLREYRCLFRVVPMIAIFPEKKKRSWEKRFYQCWVEDLIQLMDLLPDDYSTKEIVPYETWGKMGLDSHFYCYLARVNNGLNSRVFDDYFNRGLLQRCSSNISRIRFYAYAPDWKVNMIYQNICLSGET